MSAVFYFVSIIWAAVTLPLATLLCVVAVTSDGRLFGSAVLLWGLAPLIGASGWLKRKPQRIFWGVFLSIVALILSAVVFLKAPRLATNPSAKCRHLYPANGIAVQWYSPGNLLPEVDQLMLGFTLITFVDPLFSSAQSSELKLLTTHIYKELDQDPDFHALGSVLPLAYDELLGLESKNTHAYFYRSPKNSARSPVPVIVFLHGSGGNFKGYLWVLSKLADHLGAVLIAPSEGMGNWELTSTKAAVATALSAAQEIASLDQSNIHVIGLSNGGKGVSELLLNDNGDRIRSFTFLSPVFASAVTDFTSRMPILKGKRILVLTGESDDRVPLEYVSHNVQNFRRAGASVTFETIPDANHFLIFSHRESVLRSLEVWLRANEIPQQHERQTLGAKLD